MLRRRIQRWIPTPQSVRDNPSLRWLGPLLDRPWLFQLSRRRVASGAAIGVFFAFILPIAQILLAAGAAILLRANLPVAAALTLITNPFTFAPLYLAAYRLGAHVLGRTADAAAIEALGGAVSTGLLDRTIAIGAPLFTGLALFAVIGAALAWVVVNVAWIVGVRLQWRRRCARRAARQSDAG